MTHPKYIERQSERFHLQSSGRYYQSGDKNAPERLLHRRVWFDQNGPIPPGYEVHHINEDWSDNRIENLECLLARDHQRQHMLERYKDPEYRARNSENLAKAQELAKKWHSSPEGIEWHRMHGKKVFNSLTAVSAHCSVCGCEYQTFHPGRSRFCSSSCEQKEGYLRRKTATKNCILCGTEFTFNKYREQECCSRACGNRLRGARDRGIELIQPAVT